MMRDQLIDLITIGIARACVKEANGAKVDMAAEIADVLLERTCTIFLTEDEWKFDEQIDSNPWNSDAYKTITFVSDDVVDEANYEGFLYLARREKLRELLICAYPHLGYNIAGGIESATYLANIILGAGYRESQETAEEIFDDLSKFIVTKVIDNGKITYDVTDKYIEVQKKYSERKNEEQRKAD